MVDKKTITIGTLAAIVGALIMLGGVKLTDENVYFCEDKGIVMQCDKLSKYYSLPNGKCWNKETGNKLCRSGWVKVVDDVVISPHFKTADAWVCTQYGCTPL